MGRLARFASGYHISNMALTLTYPALRMSMTGDEEVLRANTFGVTNEANIGWCFLVMCLTRYLSAVTLEAWIDTMYMFAKIATAALLLVDSYARPAWYLAACAVVWLVFPRPAFAGQQELTFFTADTFDSLVLHPSRSDPNRYWLVEFTATWARPCRDAEPVVAKGSLKWTNPLALKWGKLDVGRYAHIAERFNVHAADAWNAGLQKSLPTFILFDRGQEIERLPRIRSSDGTPTEHVPVTLAVLEKRFDLRTRCRVSAGAGDAPSSSSSNRTAKHKKAKVQ